MTEFEIIRIIFLSTVAFLVAVLLTPLLTHFLYKYKLGKQIRQDPATPVYTGLHKAKSGTPTMGGILVWFTAFLLAVIFFYISRVFSTHDLLHRLNFLSRSQTLLPLGALVASALIGLVDDLFNIKSRGDKGGGLTVKHKLLLYLVIALVGAFWFFYKLDWDVIRIPFLGNFSIGWWYIPIFVFVIVATSFSVNETDGLDGLAGGVLLVAFAAYGAISFYQGRYDLSAFCGVISGGLLAFLWFNIPPARFFMGDTGAMALGTTLGIVAMLTNSALLLPIIGFVLVIESVSVIIQVISKKVRGKKVFLSAPIHHHLEAIGWPEYKIVMRFWIIAAVMAAVGVILVLLDR